MRQSGTMHPNKYIGVSGDFQLINKRHVPVNDAVANNNKFSDRWMIAMVTRRTFHNVLC